MDKRSLSLSIAIYSAVTLFKGDERPRKVIVEHPVAEEMQVDTLTSRIGANQETDLTIFF